MMYASTSSTHVVNLLNIAERKQVIRGWKLVGDVIRVRRRDGIMYVRPEALDRLIEQLVADA